MSSTHLPFGAGPVLSTPRLLLVCSAHGALLAAALWAPAASPLPPPAVAVRLVSAPTPVSVAAPPQPRSSPAPLPRPQPAARSPATAQPVAERGQQAAAPVPSAPAPETSAPPTAAPRSQDHLPVSAARFDSAYLHNPAPDYPAASRRLGEEGTVRLRVMVEANGRPGQIQLLSSSGSPRLDQAAQEAVGRWKFTPARRGEQAIAAWVIVPIVFNLKP